VARRIEGLEERLADHEESALRFEKDSLRRWR
jgi:hypothetical protein